MPRDLRKDSNFPKAAAASPQLNMTAQQTLQESPVQGFLHPRLARPVDQRRKKKRPNPGEISGMSGAVACMKISRRR